MQFIPGLDNIWVQQLDPSDPIYTYDNPIDAQNKSDELQNADTTGRKYKVTQNF
jgi:hypothetical protein